MMMVDNKISGKIRHKRIKNITVLIAVLLLILGLPLLLINYQSQKSGLSLSDVFGRKIRKTGSTLQESKSTTNLVGEEINFLDPVLIGNNFEDPPQISNIAVNDLDNNGLLDVIVCDTRNNFVSWIKQNPAGIYAEIVLASDLIAPAHVQIYDFDNDGDKDILVAVLGMLFPSNDKIGSVVVLENDGKYNFTKHVIIDKIARVSDVRAGDFNNDGNMDLAVAQFGYDDGETRWIENLGNWKFNSHILQNLSGPINVEINDIDSDGDLDIVSLVSQEWEEIYCYVNDGSGNFKTMLLWGSNNEDFGSSGIYLNDVDKDDDTDILYTNGDAFDYIPPVPRPWHGVQWLENTGNFIFKFHRICNFPGAYNCRPCDIDCDSDIDLFAVSGFNFWEKPESQSFIWMENTGNMQFNVRNIANTPTHLLTLELGDFNNDGLMDMVTGGMHTYPPYDRMSRITLWINNGLLSSER
jgi:hypothetical protein